MAMNYLIDGYNVLHHSALLAPLAREDFETARDALVEKVARFCAATGEHATIVFDGRGRQSNALEPLPGVQGLQIVYSSKQHSADTLIERRVYTAKDRKAIIVVTGDHGIQNLCSGLGALTMRPDTFLDTVREVSADLSSAAKATVQAGEVGTLEDRLDEDVIQRLHKLRGRLEKRRPGPRTKKKPD